MDNSTDLIPHKSNVLNIIADKGILHAVKYLRELDLGYSLMDLKIWCDSLKSPEAEAKELWTKEALENYDKLKKSNEELRQEIGLMAIELANTKALLDSCERSFLSIINNHTNQ